MFITMILLTTLALQEPDPAAQSGTSSSSPSSSSSSSSSSVSSSAAAAGMPTASPPGADATLGLAVLNLQTSGDVPADIAPALSGLMTAQLDKTGVFRVVSEDDVKQMVNFDQMKVALSCDDQASCLSEVGAALGVPYMLTGSLARLGSNLSLSLTLVAIDSAQVEKRTSAVYADVDALVAGLPTEVERVVATLLYRQGGNLLVQVSEEGATVAIDGAVVGTAPLPTQPVSSGPHRITVDREGFIQFALDVVVRPREVTAVDVVLRPSPAFLADYRARSGAVRGAAWGTGVGGAIGTAAGLAGVSYFFVRRDSLRTEKGVNAADDLGVDGAEYAELAGAFWGGIAAVGVGVGLLGTSTWLFVTGEDPDRYGDDVESSGMNGAVGTGR